MSQISRMNKVDFENREKNDYYATDPNAISRLMLDFKFRENIWEIACGQGHLSKEMIKNGYKVYSTDITRNR